MKEKSIKDISKSRLSFQDDIEDDEEEASYEPISKPAKRMRPSPAATMIIQSIPEENNQESANHEPLSSGHDYSAESLKALRESQRYKVKETMPVQTDLPDIAPLNPNPTTKFEDRVGLEFSGEAAEMIEEELSTTTSMEEKTNSSSSAFKELNEDEKILNDMKHASLARKQKDRRKGVGLDDDANQDDIYTNSFMDSVKASSKSAKRHVSFSEPKDRIHRQESSISVDDPDADAWEEELLRRGTLHHTMTSTTTTKPSKKEHTLEDLDLAYKNIPSFDEIISNIQKAIDSLEKEIIPAGEAKAKELEEECKRSEKEISELTKQIEERQRSFELMDNWYQRVEQIVKIIRLKESMVEELCIVYENIVREIENSITKFYQQNVEKRLHGLLSISESSVNGIDDYFIPSKEFSESVLQKKPFLISEQSYEQFVDQSPDSSYSSILSSFKLLDSKEMNMIDITVYLTQSMPNLMERIKTMTLASQAIYEDSSVSISSMLEIFEDYRNRMFDRYNNSYMSLSLPELLDQLIKVDLYSTFPYLDKISLSNININSWSWFQEIQRYSLSVKSEHLQRSILPESEMDVTLLPRVLSRTLMPWQLITLNAFDPLSSQQSIYYVRVCQDLFQFDVPLHDLGRMLHLIADRFEISLSWICMPITSKPSFLRSTKKKASRFNDVGHHETLSTDYGDHPSNIDGDMKPLPKEFYEFILYELKKVLSWLRNLSMFESLLSSDVRISLIWKGMMMKIFPSLEVFLCQKILSSASNNHSVEIQAFAAAIIVLSRIFSLVPQATYDQVTNTDRVKMVKLSEMLGSISINRVDATMIIDIKARISELLTESL